MVAVEILCLMLGGFLGETFLDGKPSMLASLLLPSQRQRSHSVFSDHYFTAVLLPPKFGLILKRGKDLKNQKGKATHSFTHHFTRKKILD